MQVLYYIRVYPLFVKAVSNGSFPNYGFSSYEYFES